MAEVIGVIGSLISIWDGLQKFRRYARDVINAPTEREEFLRRLSCIETVHRALQGSTEASKDAAWVQELSPTMESSPVYRLVKTMEQMAEILHLDEELEEKGVKKKWKNMKWHSEKRDLEVFFNQIKDHCINILVVLQWGEMEILREVGKKSEDAAANLTKIEEILIMDRKNRHLVDDATLETAKNVEEGRREAVEATRITATRLNSIEARLQAEEELKQKERATAERKEVEKWLSPLEFARRQQIIFEKAASFQKGRIGKWFFECEEFNLWRDGKIRILRGLGQPGAGKTILSSVVVEELTKTHPECPVISVYLEKAERLIQTVKNIRGSLLKQLIQFKESGLTTAIRTAFNKASRTNTVPNDDVTNQLLKAEVEIYPRVFIVVDGLDEASDETRRLIDDQLHELHKTKLSLLIMSRPDDVNETEAMFCDKCDMQCIQFYHCQDCAKISDSPAGICFACQEKGETCVNGASHLLKVFTPEECEVAIKTPSEDIETFLRTSIMEEFPKELKSTDLRSPLRGVKTLIWQCYHKPELMSDIIQHIVDESDGRFLLAREYIKHFKNKNTLKDIKAALKIKSESGVNKLFPFYAEDMERIMKQEAEDVDLAKKVLQTVYFAKRNMTLIELQQALAVADGDTEYDPDGESHEGRILHVTKGLIAIDRNTSNDNECGGDMTVRFDHLTRREYFDTCWWKWFPEGKVEIANMCLTFLEFDDFAEAYNTEEEFRAKEKELPFISYAVQFWGDHVREAGPGATSIVGKAVSYLKDPSRVEAYIQAAWTANTRHKDKWDVRRSIHPLHICAWFDLGHLIPSLEYGRKEINVQETTHGQTPLMYACRRGSVATVRRLLEAGALVYKQSQKGRTALFEAILRLKKAPEQNSDDDVEKSEQIVELLLDESLKGDQLNINIQNPKHLQQTALITSIEWQQSGIAQSILQHPHLQINLQNLDGVTALQLAACNGLVDVVHDLLQQPMINVNMTEKGENRSALHLGAKYSCNPQVVSELLQHGADPNLKDDRGGTPILRAVEAGNEQAYHLLASSTSPIVDISCVDEDGRGLLHFAAATENIKILSELIEKLPNCVNLKDQVGMTPLHEACRAGSLATAQLLLENGADPNSKDTLGRTPLHVAQQYGNAKLADLMKEKMATDSLASELPIWSLAALRRWNDIKAAIPAQSLQFDLKEPRTLRNALHCTMITNANEEEDDNEDIQNGILKDLLDAGKLSVDDVDKHGQTPLHFAAMFGNIEGIKLLLSHDAETEVVDRFGMRALRIACRNHYFEAAVTLIEGGAEIDTEHLDLNQLLFTALSQHNITAVGLLIEAGADRMAQDEQGRTPDMVAEKDARLSAILKSTKSYRFKAPTLVESSAVDIDLLEETIQDAEEMLSEMKDGKTPDTDISLGGKSARKVRFTPFASRAVNFESEKETIVGVNEVPAASTQMRGLEVERLLEGVTVKGIPSPVQQAQPTLAL